MVEIRGFEPLTYALRARNEVTPLSAFAVLANRVLASGRCVSNAKKDLAHLPSRLLVEK